VHAAVRSRALALVVLLVGLASWPAPVAADPDRAVVDHAELRVDVHGERRVPVTLARDAVVDLTQGADGRPAGVSVVAAEGALDRRHDRGFGIALLERGRPEGALVAVVFGEGGRPMLVQGQQRRLGTPRPLVDAVACTRCSLPAGEYDLLTFGPGSAAAADRRVQVALRLEGLPAGVAQVGSDVGEPEMVLGFARHRLASDGAFGGWSALLVLVAGPGPGPRDGILLTEARVPATAVVASSTSITSSGTRLDQDAIPGTDEPAPHADGYGAGAAAGPGSTVAVAQTSALRSFDPDTDVLFHSYDATAVGTRTAALDTALLWLPTSPSTGVPDRWSTLATVAHPGR
jgi:hypothetical protein